MGTDGTGNPSPTTSECGLLLSPRQATALPQTAFFLIPVKPVSRGPRLYFRIVIERM